MVLVILAVGLLLFVGGFVVCVFTDMETGGSALGTIGMTMTVGALIAIICLGVDVTRLNTVDTRIEMYQQENAKIEENITNTIEQYQEYESGVYAEITPNSSIEMVVVYPELKSDTLIQKQIENYISNNERIRSLQEEKIQGSVIRWWLYFGK